MSVIGSNILAGASGQFGYNLDKSLRLRSSASAYLSRTPASAGNRQIWTYSTWVKRGSLGSQQDVFISGSNVSSNLSFQNSFNSSDNFLIYASLSGVSNDIVLQTTQVFRDPSAWYHIIIAVDTTQATSSNRVKLYINGSQVTSFSTATYPTQNYSTSTNNTVAHTIGRFTNVSANYFDGYMAETHLVDGQALTPSSFGETSTTTGVWQPKRYAGSYGTNGFYLPFTDNSALTSGSNAGLGKDFSGNGNYWNTNNISITSGATYDSMTDVPTLTSATAANFSVFNPLSAGQSSRTSDGNLKSYSLYENGVAPATIAISSGKFYWEYTCVGFDTGENWLIGIFNSTTNNTSGTKPSYAYDANGNKYNGSYSSYGATYTTNDVIGIAYDADNGTITFYKNGTSQGTAFTGITAGSYYPCAATDGTRSGYGVVGNINFGQRPFAYTPPTGYVALNTYNLPTPTIGATASTLANRYFDVLTYTGNGSDGRAVTGLNFQPDFVWIKRRNDVDYHNLFDAVRGATKRLFSNDIQAENTSAATLQSFNSNGFTVGTNDNVNANASPLVAWCWDANGAGSSNTAGSITSTVSANTSAGFSVVTYTGNGSSAQTIGHGLGVAPKMLIVKQRGSTTPWAVYHGAGNNPANVFYELNTTSGGITASSVFGANPTSTVFTVGTDTNCNANGGTYVAYCFSEVAGYSKFGSYTGNGSSDGVFVATGFRPRFVLIKRTETTTNWVLLDTSRDTYNASGLELFPNLSNAENDNRPEIDFLSNGFKLRWTYTGTNASGGNYIYMAFAEHPFKYSLAR